MAFKMKGHSLPGIKQRQSPLSTPPPEVARVPEVVREGEVPSSPAHPASDEEGEQAEADEGEGDFSGHTPPESEESDTESVWSSEGEHERWKQMSYGERFAHCQGWVSCIRCPPTELIHEQVIN